jgi:hypothetical protein
MSRNPRLYLEDIQHSCAKVLRFTAGLSFEQFKQDDRTYDAVLRNLEIIGEAAKNVPNEIRQRIAMRTGTGSGVKFRTSACSVNGSNLLRMPRL